MTCCSRTYFKTLVAATVLAIVRLASAGTAQEGDALPSLSLQDQHARSVIVPADTRLVFFAGEMASSKVMSTALEALPPTALEDGKAVYIADISGMPGPISALIALPRMRKLPYPVALVTDANETSAVPRKAGTVTVLRTQGGKITAVDYASTPEQVAAYLK